MATNQSVLDVTNEVKDYWPNGILRRHDIYRGNTREFKGYYYDGVLRIRQFFCKSPYNEAWLLTGELKCYHKNGVLSVHSHFVNDQLNGVRKMWDTRGNLLEIERWHNGVPCGIRWAWWSRTCPAGYEYLNADKITDISFRIVLSLMYAKNRLRKLVKRKISTRYLDPCLIPDLGNIVMRYYYKAN
jgi:hypothetical protein